MRTVAHLSDLHFGAADRALVRALVSCLREMSPDAVAVSGDLTQRARRAQFREAREFLDALALPLVVVPGNHDVPLFNVAARFLFPLAGYRRYISRERHPALHDEKVVILGADTTRRLTIKDGGLRPAAVERLVAQLKEAPPAAVKIVVCHHPFDRVSGLAAMERLVASGADVFLTGHLHLSYAGHTAVRYGTADRSAIVVEAGTATSFRARGEANAFNVLRLERDRVRAERFEWMPDRGAYAAAHRDEFVRTAGGWAPLPHA
jgi:3',5'-cyclic AMP phosphodiesterase CpdA